MSVIFPIELCRKYYERRLMKLFEDPDELRKFVRGIELWGKQGKDIIRVLIPIFIYPSFVWAFDEESEGIGRGDGEEGDTIDRNDQGDQHAGGDGHAHHIRQDVEWWMTMEDFYDLIFKALKLPPLTPRAYGMSPAPTSVLRSKKKIQGPHRLFKDSYIEALKRIMTEDPDFDPEDISRPIIINPSEDIKTRRAKTIEKESGRALIMVWDDISGSISEERKYIEREMTSWIKALVKKYYKRVEEIHLVHDTQAWIVSEEEFYDLKSAGGTNIGSVISLGSTILTPGHPDRRKIFHGRIVEYSPFDYDVFFVGFSDGESWSREDDKKCTILLTKGNESDSHAGDMAVEALLPKLYRCWYGQTSLSGSETAFHTVFKPLEKKFPGIMRAALIENADWIFQALQHFCKTKEEIEYEQQ